MLFLLASHRCQRDRDNPVALTLPNLSSRIGGTRTDSKDTQSPRTPSHGRLAETERGTRQRAKTRGRKYLLARVGTYSSREEKANEIEVEFATSCQTNFHPGSIQARRRVYPCPPLDKRPQYDAGLDFKLAFQQQKVISHSPSSPPGPPASPQHSSRCCFS